MKLFHRVISCFIIFISIISAKTQALNKNALFIINNPAELNAADQLIVDKMSSMEINIVQSSAAEANIQAANDVDIILISSSILSSELTDSFASIAVPIITWEGGIYNTLKMCSDGAWGISTMSSDLALFSEPGHAIGNGLQATASIVSSTPQIYTIIKEDSLPAGAVKVAIIEDDLGDEQTVVFCYENGAPLVDGSSSPARRIGFFMHDHTATEMTDSGWKIFENAVMWALYGNATKVAERASAPQTSGLLKNYPNPFNPETTINYQVSKQANISIEIFDFAGKHVTTLRHGTISVGNHETTWHGTDERGQAVPSGVYFVRMIEGNRYDIRKILLTK
jgi:hypothetical protein